MYTTSKNNFMGTSIPSQLKSIPSWLLWVLKGNKKVPLNLSGYPTDPTKGFSYSAAVSAMKHVSCNGLGFIAGEGIIAVDLDHCLVDGVLSDTARQLVDELQTYTEISVSGTGLHLFYVDKTAPAVGKKSKQLELYTANHYIALTGNRLAGTPAELSTLTGKTAELLSRYFSEKREYTEQPNDEDNKILNQLSDDEKFNRLFYEGNTSGYPSQSEADSALMIKLVIHTKNPDQLRRLFSQSALGKRDKWQSKYYQEYQINNALKLAKSLDDEKLKALDILQQFYETNELTIQVYESAAICKSDSNLYQHYESFRKYCKQHKKELNVRVSEVDEQIQEYEKILLQKKLDSIGKLIPPNNIHYNIPTGYQVNTQGIYGMTKSGYKRICKSAIFITDIITNHSTHDIKLNLLTYTKGFGWKTIDMVDNTILNNSRLIPAILGAKLTSINTNNAPHLINYFDDFIECNYKNINKLQSTTKLGWIDNCFVTPYNTDKYVLDTNDNTFAQCLQLNGTFNDWKHIVQPAFDYSYISRFIISTCFATVLLEPLSARPFSIYLWGKSTFKKSTVFQIGASVWGTSDLIVTFGGTLNGFIGGAVERIGFPYIIDDKQQKRNNIDINRLIMTLNNGKSDLKMTKDSLIKPVSHWKTIGLFNGEEPLIDTFATDGVHTRTVSIHINSEILSEEISDTIWSQLVDKQTGHAGKLFVDNLKSVDWETLIQQKTDLYKTLQQQFPEHHEEHLKAVSLVMLTERLVSEHIFQTDSKAEEMGSHIISSLDTKITMSNSETEWEHLVSWIAANQQHFKRKNTPLYTECYGEYKKDYLAITKSALEEEFKNWGNINIHKLLEDFVQQGLIIPYPDKNKKSPRKVWNTTINEVNNVPAVKISLKLLKNKED